MIYNDKLLDTCNASIPWISLTISTSFSRLAFSRKGTLSNTLLKILITFIYRENHVNNIHFLSFPRLRLIWIVKGWFPEAYRRLTNGCWALVLDNNRTNNQDLIKVVNLKMNCNIPPPWHICINIIFSDLIIEAAFFIAYCTQKIKTCGKVTFTK